MSSCLRGQHAPFTHQVPNLMPKDNIRPIISGGFNPMLQRLRCLCWLARQQCAKVLEHKESKLELEIGVPVICKGQGNSS